MYCIAITGHYIDSAFQLHSELLAFENLEANHTGPYLASMYSTSLINTILLKNSFALLLTMPAITSRCPKNSKICFTTLTWTGTPALITYHVLLILSILLYKHSSIPFSVTRTPALRSKLSLINFAKSPSQSEAAPYDGRPFRGVANHMELIR